MNKSDSLDGRYVTVNNSSIKYIDILIKDGFIFYKRKYKVESKNIDDSYFIMWSRATDSIVAKQIKTWKKIDNLPDMKLEKRMRIMKRIQERHLISQVKL